MQTSQNGCSHSCMGLSAHAEVRQSQNKFDITELLIIVIHGWLLSGIEELTTV